MKDVGPIRLQLSCLLASVVGNKCDNGPLLSRPLDPLLLQSSLRDLGFRWIPYSVVSSCLHTGKTKA
jgi:hypothetical protein